jgi:isopenicillin N synthase-like dioxygenase
MILIVGQTAFTILNQDMVGGLEVLNKNGVYIKAKPIRGTFVVNIGDFLQRISNDKFVSTVHRVRNTMGVERYSVPFFFSFNMDAEVPVRKQASKTFCSFGYLWTDP